MKLTTVLFLTLFNFRTNKIRTFLTILGLAIGVGSVVFLVSLGYGLQKLTLEKLTAAKSFNSLEVTTGNSEIIKVDDKTVIDLKSIQGVDKVSTSLQLSGQSKFKETLTDTTVIAVQQDFLDLEGIKTQSGRLPKSKSKEIILTKAVLDNLGIKDLTGILNQKLTFLVSVPHYTEQKSQPEVKEETYESTLVGIIADEKLTYGYTPIENFNLENPVYSSAKVSLKDPKEGQQVRKIIEEKGYTVSSVVDIIDQVNQIFNIAKIALSVFGLIALLVASIGMFNTLTISLLERIREIGIMKSIGATSGDIYKLFLAESLIMGFLGGVMGIYLGWSLSELVNIIIGRLAMSVGAQSIRIAATPVSFVGIALLFSLLVGVVTGFYPARRGAKLNPLDALRYE